MYAYKCYPTAQPHVARYDATDNNVATWQGHERVKNHLNFVLLGLNPGGKNVWFF